MHSPPVLVIPGLEGTGGLVEAVQADLFPGLSVTIHEHRLDRVEGGPRGMAERALAAFDRATGQPDAPLLLCGESFGGVVALTLARHFPERVGGLVLLSSFGWYPRLSALGGRAGMRVWDLLGNRATDLVLRTTRPLTRPIAFGLRASPTLVQAYLQQPPMDLAAYRAKCELSLRFDARPWLAEVRCPTLLVCGSFDAVVPPAASVALAAGLPKARLVRLVGGHSVAFARAREVGGLLRRWLDEEVVAGTGLELATGRVAARMGSNGLEPDE